jgi:hypothetical protein
MARISSKDNSCCASQTKIPNEIGDVEVSEIEHSEILGADYANSALTEHHAMKAYWGSGDIAPLIL